MSPTADVVVAGAGIAGIGAAEALSRRLPGASVLLVDPLPPLSLTSAVSGELYRNWWLDERMALWIHRSIQGMEAVAAGCGNAFGMNRRGYAFVYTTPGGTERAREDVARWAGFGLGPVRVHDGIGDDYRPSPPEAPRGTDADFGILPDGVDLLVDPDLIHRHFPWVTRDARAVVHARRGGWLDARGFGLELLGLARERGVGLLRGEVVDVHVEGGGVRAVEVAGKEGGRTVETRLLVDAAGPFLGRLAAIVGVDLPVTTVLHQLVLMPDPRGAVPRDAPYTILMEPQALDWSDEERRWLEEEGLERLLQPLPGALHLRPEGPRASSWIRLGWPYNQLPEAPRLAPGLPPEFPEVVVRGAARLCPGMAPYARALPPRLTQTGGYYTRTAENLPLIGPTPVEGFWLMGALSGYGLMAARAAGETLAAWIDGEPEPGSRYFSLERYRDPTLAVPGGGHAAAGEL